MTLGNLRTLIDCFRRPVGKLHAIKEIKYQTGCTLKEAKDLVENLITAILSNYSYTSDYEPRQIILEQAPNGRWIVSDQR